MRHAQNAQIVADAVAALITNNTAAFHPLYDEHAIEIGMALFLLYATDRNDRAANWISEMMRRFEFGLAL